MRTRLKKLISTAAILIWLALYAFTAMRLGLAILPDANPLLTLAYYAIAGTLWIVPIGLALPWMHREPGPRA